MYYSKDGAVVNSVFPEEFNSKLINVANKQSVIYSYLNFLRVNENTVQDIHSQHSGLIPSFILALNLNINLDVIDFEECFHFDDYSEKSNGSEESIFMNQLISKFNSTKYLHSKVMNYTNQNNLEYPDLVDIKDIKLYLKKIKKIEIFIKLFKSDLVSIDVEYSENGEFYVVKKYFNYGDYRIDILFESEGIKKLFKLYKIFSNLQDGQIVFYDELDANINDVYLSRLVEYVSEYTSGQLIFTCHNLGPMEVLKRKKKSIDFITNVNGIVEWTKNGNYSVINLYREGMIKNHPFNLQSYDLLKIFSQDCDNQYNE